MRAIPLVLKFSTPAISAVPFSARRLVDPPPRKMLRVPPLRVRLPTVRDPIEAPLPGVMDAPEAIVTAELVAFPVPARIPEFTPMAPVPLLVPLRINVPALIMVVPA